MIKNLYIVNKVMYTSHEGITEYNKDTQMYTLRKIIYRPSIDIYITVKHDNFINKFMEVLT